MKTYEFKATKKPKWFQFRWRVSNLLVKIAKRIYPENPEVMAFYAKLLTDTLIYGQSITQVDMSEIYEKAGTGDTP